mgnify:FL=1
MVENYEAKLKEYAALLVHMGVHLRPGQTLFLQATVECADLARLCAEEAYAAGAREVDTVFSDNAIARMKYLHAADEVFDTMPDWSAAHYEQLRQSGAAKLSLIGEDPELLRGVDVGRIQRWNRAVGVGLEAYYRDLTANRFEWSLGGYATAAWARKVFPELPEAEAVDRLWDAVFAAARVEGDGRAAERWEQHIATLAHRTEWLNARQFRFLHYQNALGTDLTVELPEGHYWAGGAEHTPAGNRFVANIPTEEVFTLPLRTGVNGVVFASKPLVLHGQIVDGIRFTFRDGKIAEASAAQGEEALRKAVATDEGASYLGEVALVPTASPISESGILFYNTLFDENAACHLAFGEAYPCIRGAEAMTDEELKARGVNYSCMHEDFMVGTPDLSITGVTRDGTEIAVFRNGNFAF